MHKKIISTKPPKMFWMSFGHYYYIFGLFCFWLLFLCSLSPHVSSTLLLYGFSSPRSFFFLITFNNLNNNNRRSKNIRIVKKQTVYLTGPRIMIKILINFNSTTYRDLVCVSWLLSIFRRKIKHQKFGSFFFSFFITQFRFENWRSICVSCVLAHLACVMSSQMRAREKNNVDSIDNF